MTKQHLIDAMRFTRSTIDGAIMDLTVNNLAPSSVATVAARYKDGVKRMSGYVQKWNDNYSDEPVPFQ